MKILVVEDTESLRTLMGLVFKDIFGDSYEILLAKNGEEAINIVLNEENIKLIITDLNMPKKNGIELAEFVRQQGSKIKILIISNGADQNIQDEARGVADMFLDKTDFLNYTPDNKKRDILYSLLG